MDNYKDYPQSLAEIKGGKSRNSADWGPRDALIAALRDIDSGDESPHFVVVLFGKLDESGGTDASYYNATPNRYIHNGMIWEHLRRLACQDAGGSY